MDLSIRRATAEDAKDILTIYRHYIEHSAVSFELEVPSSLEIASRIQSAQQKHEWIVGLFNEKIIADAWELDGYTVEYMVARRRR